MELWDLIDQNRKSLNITHERGKSVPEGTYHLVVHICIFNQNGEMLIQKRTSDREVWASYWDVSAAGSVLSKESSSEAAHRETLEEIGLDIDFSNEKPYLSITGKDWISDWYLLELHKEISLSDYQKEEVEQLSWASLSDILQLKQNGSFIPYHDGFVELLFAMRKKRGAIL